MTIQATPTGEIAVEAEASPAAISRPYRTYAMWLLLAIYTLNFVDRQILNILAEPIKRDLHLADWQLGLLTGLAFALFYTVLGLPLARLADRANRVRIISAALATWSLFTAACGLAQNFTQLLLFRIGVGIGEAGCTPTAHSLITDYTPKEKRASALAFYSMGIPLGSMAGMAIGGLVADAYGWRVALMAVGAPGLLLAVVSILTLRETRTDLKRAHTAMAEAAPSFRETMRELASKKSFWWAAVGGALTSFVSYGHSAFYGSFFFRNHAADLERLSSGLSDATGVNLGPAGFIGMGLGLMVGISGVAGTWLGGVSADRAAARDARAYMSVPAIGAALGVPFVGLAMFSHSALTALCVLALPLLLKSIWYGPVYACAQSLVQPRSRATSAAVILFIINLVGLGFGPLLVGALSDALAVRMGEGEGLRWALALSALVGFAASGCFLMARRTIREELVS